MSTIYKLLLDYIRGFGGMESFAKPSAAFLCVIIRIEKGNKEVYYEEIY